MQRLVGSRKAKPTNSTTISRIEKLLQTPIAVRKHMKYYYLDIISYIIYAYILWFSLMDVYTKMVSHSSNTTKTAMTNQKINIIPPKERKQEEEYNDPFFDRKVKNSTDGLKSDCYKQFYNIP
jgi:hypothetical protein